MSMTTDKVLDQIQDKQWHWDNCEVEQENDPDKGSFAWCEHMDLTDLIPDYEPDLYDNSEENEGVNV